MQDQKPNVSPQEQSQYDGVMAAARGIIFGDPSKPEDNSAIQTTVAKLAANRQDPAMAIGHTAAMVITAVKGGVEQQGKTVPDDILFHAGQEIVQDLVDISTAAKLIPPKAAPEIAKQAIFQGLKIYGEQELQMKQQKPPGPPQPGQPAQPAQPPQPAMPAQGVAGSVMGAP